jgi:excinuclease UvrABC ATPase subunit
MTSVKIWCEACIGTGIDRLKQLQGRIDYDCEKCDGKGFKTWTIEQLASQVTIHDGTFSCAPADAYTISDAEVDAKVLATVSGTGLKQTDAICYEIVNRLHAFYCGGTK